MKLPKIFKRDYVTTVSMILVVILIVLTFWFGLRFILKTEHPILAVASGSMEPVLYKGDLILVENSSLITRFDEILRCGDSHFL